MAGGMAMDEGKKAGLWCSPWEASGTGGRTEGTRAGSGALDGLCSLSSG